MGLTIHYGIQSVAKSLRRAAFLVETMRQMAMDFGFERVDDKVRYYGPEVCQIPLEELRGKDELFHAVLEGMKYTNLPWHKKQRGSISVQPLELFIFNTVPGPGSEWATFGLARYPTEVECTYRPQEDDKFTKTIKNKGMTSWRFDHEKWWDWLEKKGHPRYSSPEDFEETRKIKTHLSGWRWGAFCKTQYASDPAAGGVPNFVRCHLSVIHLLDKIGTLPGIKVNTNDEGKYGRSYYTDDPWAEERVYTWHDGQYNVPRLIQEVGEWNEMIAAQFGALKDAAGVAGMGIEAPIASYSSFEQLEFKGANNERLKPFLDAMRTLAKKQAQPEEK